MNMVQVFSMVVKEQGVGGLFKVCVVRPPCTHAPPHDSARLICAFLRLETMGTRVQGIVPRIGLGIWQTLFMVTGVKLVKDTLKEGGYIQ